MDRFNALGRGAQLMLVAGILLFISLFLPWQDFDVGGIADELGVDATFSGWRGVGVVLGILTIVLVAWIAVRLAAIDIPLPISTAMTSAILGALVLIFAVIKLLTILGDEATIWAWIGVILAVLVAVGAWLEVQAAGGMNTLRSEMPTGSSSGPPPAASAPPVGTTPSTPEAAAPPMAEPQVPEPPAAPQAPTDAPPREPEAPYDPDDRREA
jgi:hypothetical protein